MEIEFTRKTDKDFRKHREYLRRTGKADGHKYQEYELDGISKSLKANIITFFITLPTRNTHP